MTKPNTSHNPKRPRGSDSEYESKLHQPKLRKYLIITRSKKMKITEIKKMNMDQQRVLVIRISIPMINKLH